MFILPMMNKFMGNSPKNIFRMTVGNVNNYLLSIMVIMSSISQNIICIFLVLR